MSKKQDKPLCIEWGDDIRYSNKADKESRAWKDSTVMCKSAAACFDREKKEAEKMVQQAEKQAEKINNELESLAEAFKLAFNRVFMALPAGRQFEPGIGHFPTMELRAEVRPEDDQAPSTGVSILWITGVWGAVRATVKYDGDAYTYRGFACGGSDEPMTTRDREQVLQWLGSEIARDHPYRAELGDIRRHARRLRGEKV